MNLERSGNLKTRSTFTGRRQYDQQKGSEKQHNMLENYKKFDIISSKLRQGRVKDETGETQNRILNNPEQQAEDVRLYFVSNEEPQKYPKHRTSVTCFVFIYILMNDVDGLERK